MQTKKLSNGQEFWVCTVTGEVLSSDKSSHVSIHQDAPMVLSEKLVVPGAIRSRTTVNHEVWIRSADGKEKQVDIGGIGLPVRTGHVITVAWGATQTAANGPYLGARNHTTGKTVCDILNAGINAKDDLKLSTAASANFWRWTIGCTFLAALYGGMTNRSFEVFLVFGGIGLLLTGVFRAIGFLSFVLGGKAVALIGEINDFIREQLLAGEPMKVDIGAEAANIAPVEPSVRAASNRAVEMV